MSKPSTLPHPGMGFREFVALMAALMATNALAIDSMLPALPQIGASIGIEGENQGQWIITAYLLGFGASQLLYGTLSDRFGRKPVLLAGLVGYVVFSMLSALATGFSVMMIARTLQGISGGATRVLTMSIVRDCYTGRQMARVMSLAFIVFLAVPILAPSIGQAIMLIAPWRFLFGALAVFAAVVMLWTLRRLPETLPPGARSEISIKRVTQIFGTILTNRSAIGYTIAMTLIMGALFGFINSAQQIFDETFTAPRLFTTVFAMIATFIGLSSFVNARVVGRLGMRRVSHYALLGFIVVTGIHLLVAASGHENLVSFAVLQSFTMFCFGLIVSNFGSMAMEPLGHVAGTAASVQGFLSTIGGALIGFAIGQSYDHTTVPLVTGSFVLSVLAMVTVFITEKGRLFGAHHVALVAE